MPHLTADVVICGAGLAGVAAAYHLTVRQGMRRVLLVDARPPLTLTSDKSTECYRNWWPGPDAAMVELMNRSIDWLEALAEEYGNPFHMNRRGYMFLTATDAGAALFKATAERGAALGAGPLRVHAEGTAGPAYQPAPATGYQAQPAGADLLLTPAHIRRLLPFVAEDTLAVLHVRRCGWLRAQTLGMLLLEQARANGATLMRGQLRAVRVEHGRVTGVRVEQPGGTTHIPTGCFVNAAGPYLKQVGRLLGIDLPVTHELHGKLLFTDTQGMVPRDTPLLIWSDPLTIPWSAEERHLLQAQAATHWLLRALPAGAHFRPEGGPDSQMLVLLWPYQLAPTEPVWPPRFPPEYAELVLRGVSRMVPGFAAYQTRLHRPVVEGGYYCKTRENRPLIGPFDVSGAYVIGALSGFGIMASLAAGELLAAYIAGQSLPGYAPAFAPSRYDDPAYQHSLKTWDGIGGQL